MIERRGCIGEMETAGGFELVPWDKRHHVVRLHRHPDRLAFGVRIELFNEFGQDGERTAVGWIEDAENLTKWLKHLLAEEAPPAEVNGIWCGLNNPILADGEPSCQMYIGGSSTFDPNSESNEWVCRLTWWPEGRYSASKVLTEIYRSVEAVSKNKVSYLGEAFLCHGYLALVVSHWCNGPMRAALLGDAPIRAVVIGHDSGDFYRMAVLRAK